MNDNVSIQLFLRGLVLDFIQENCSNNKWKYDPANIGTALEVPISFVTENTQNNSNTSGIIIEEGYRDVIQTGYTDFTSGVGFYYLDLSDDRGTGLRLKRFAQQILAFFDYGTYDVNETTSFVIENIKVVEFESEPNDKKVHLSVEIEFTKYN